MWLTDGSVAVASRFKVPEFIVGLTIVAVGTSMPELTVSFMSAIAGKGDMAIGNVVGSNICNLLLVLGLSAIFTPLTVKRTLVKREFPFLVGISVLFVIFGIFFGVKSQTDPNSMTNAITRWEAIIFIVLMIVYMIMIVKLAKRDQRLELQNNENATQGEQGEDDDDKNKPLWQVIILCIIGLAGVIIGGEMVVCGAKGLATHGASAIGMDPDLTEALVGLTVVAVGTSLPELVTSVMAAKKGEVELAIGNVVGSNVFNTLFILGIAGTVNPLTTGSQIIVDLLVMLGATVLVYVMAFNKRLSRWNGIVMVLAYVAYLSYLITRTLAS
jgi:cation:H+ antiporter